jgi:hypothetical protein
LETLGVPQIEQILSSSVEFSGSNIETTHLFGRLGGRTVSESKSGIQGLRCTLYCTSDLLDPVLQRDVRLISL